VGRSGEPPRNLQAAPMIMSKANTAHRSMWRGSRERCLIFQRIISSLRDKQSNTRSRMSFLDINASRRIDAAPAAETPRRVPARAPRRCRRHAVDARRAPGLAAQQARQRHPASTPETKPLDCLIAINRTGRQMPTVIANQRRQRVTVNPDQRASNAARDSLVSPGAMRAVR
jgi:hypothetical protein